MAKIRRNTYGSLSSKLKSLGFKAVKGGGHVLFSHPTGRPVIALPIYKTAATVSPIHLIMVRKQLLDAGLIPDENTFLNPTPKTVKSRTPDLRVKS